MNDSTRKATREEVTAFLRVHYRNLVNEANSATWVPMLDAIDAYEREPKLKAQLETLQTLMAKNESSHSA